MGLETGTFINDLVITNPPGTDDKRQGDDHLRLIKSVLKNTFLRATRAWSLPGGITKTANYAIQDADENLTFVCDTTAGSFTLTLPTLDSTRLGWKIYVVKTNLQPNPVFLAPSAGTINGYSKIRRTIENTITEVMWLGSWVASRPNGGAPIGSVVEYYGVSLPNGHLWADGAAYAAVNFTELNAVVPILPDRRGRSAIGRDGAGPAGTANRVTTGGSGINSTVLVAAGGFESVGLNDPAQLAPHTHGVNQSPHTHGADPHSHTFSAIQSAQVSGTSLSFAFLQTLADGATGNIVNTTSPATVTIQNANANVSILGTGSGTPHQNMPPVLVCNAIVVAE